MAVPKALIDQFLAERKLAFIGVSRNKQQFGNAAFREMVKAGYEVFPVHPTLQEIDGHRCYARLIDVPEKVGGLVSMVAAEQSAQVVSEAAVAGIDRIWFQQQSSCDDALKACELKGISAVHDECILMFLQGTGFPHRVHKFVRGLFGRMPR